jgi:hypothetical protein
MGPIERVPWPVHAVLLLVLGCGADGIAPGTDGGEPGITDARVDVVDVVDANSDTVPAAEPLPALPEYRGRIAITPTAVLFTRLGDRTMLRPEVLDAAGRPVSATGFTWESSRPDMVAVDAQGQVTAMAALGSSQIRARANGMVSAPLTVIVAQPAAGAVLVADAQIVAGPTAMDPAVATEVGSRVTLSVEGVSSLAPGTVLLASEGKSVAGRVVSATPVPGGDRQDVVLELIPLLDLFERLDVDTSYDIDAAAMSEALAHQAPPSAKPLPPGEFMLGPFKCEKKLVFGAISGTGSVDLRPQMTFNQRFIKDEATGDWKEIMVKLEGTMTVTGSVGITFAPGFVGSLSCEKVVAKIPVPAGGPVSALLRLEIPLSIEGEISATTAIATVKGVLELKGITKITLGFHYTPQTGTTDLGSYENMNELKPTFTVPGAYSTASVTVGVAVGAGAGVNLATLVGSLNLLKAALMLKAELKATAIRTGLVFGGAYDLKPTLEAGAGSDVKKAMRWFGGLVTVDSTLTLTLPVLAQSPRGRLTADRATLQLMEPVTLTVDLDPMTITYLGIDNVVDVRFYRPHPSDADLQELATIGGAPGKVSFKHTYTPTPQDLAAGKVTFWAGVSTRLLPGVAVEVNDMSKLEVKVGGASRWKGQVVIECSQAYNDDPSQGDTYTESMTATIDLEHLTEADAMMANARVMGMAKYTAKMTHDFRGGEPGCPVDVHEELNTLAEDFQPIVFQTRFDDTSGAYALIGSANVNGIRVFTHTETGPCTPGFTRNEPPTPYQTSVGYIIDGMVAPTAASFSGSKRDGDERGECVWTWSFGRL